MNFSRQASSFLRAGVPILDSLAVVAEEGSSKKMQEVLADVQRRLRAGSGFGDAIAQHPQVFPGYYVAVVRASELTGQLDDALDQLSSYLEREVEARKQVKSALTYPAIVFGLAIVAMIVMAVYVLPKFRSLYSSLHAHLPLPTRMLLGFTNFLTNWWWAIALVAIAVVIGGYALFGGTQGKKRRDATLLGLPAVGKLVKLIAVERFCRVLATLVQSGVPLPDAVQVSADSTNNWVFQSKLSTVRDAMMRGDGLARPIQASGIFPPAARQMIRVGETTGSLDHQLENAAKFYERELSYELKRFTDMFEPAVLIIVGLAVALRRARPDLRHVQHLPPSEALSSQNVPAGDRQPNGPLGTCREEHSAMNDYIEDRREQGFTLIELLIAIVVVGILAAVAIVGIAGLTNSGKTSACQASEDTAKAASAAFYANQQPNRWPASFDEMTTKADGPAPATVNDPVVMELSSGVTPAGNVLNGPGWTLTATFSAAATPDFTSAGNGCANTP